MPHLPRTCVAALLAVISLPAVALAQLPGGTTWALVFADEFAGGTLDTMKWSPNYSWGRTHNHQAYMDPGQLTVSDGRLRIQAVQERHPDAPSHAVHDGKWYRLDYTSGAVNTANTFRFTNGYIEARMRLPGEIGAWAAFWTLGQGWPPEIDIMEYPIMDHNQSGNDKYRYWVNYHYGPDWTQHRSYGREHWQGRDLSGGYNTYGLEWTENDRLHFYLNGSRVYSVTDAAAVSQLQNQYLILNHAVGGWPGEPPSWPSGGSNFDIDWVRVWQRQHATAERQWLGTEASGSWTDAANWTTGFPKQGGHLARFGDVAGRPSVAVTWNDSQTLAGIVLDSSTTRYTLGNGTQSLLLADGPGGDGWVGIQVEPGGSNHTINSRLDLYGRFSVWNDGGLLTLSRDIIEQAGGFASVGEMSVGGTGTTILSGQSRLSGPLSVRGGMFAVTGRLFSGSVASDAVVTIDDGTLYVGNFSEAATGSLGNLPADADRVVINGGTLRLAGSGSSGRGFTIGSQGGTLEVQGGVTATLTESLAAGDGIVATSGGRLTLAGGGDGTLAKRLAGPGGLVKQGSGNWTLPVANGHLGGTRVEAGRLIAASPTALGGGGVEVATGATLQLGGAGSLNAEVAGGGTIEAAQPSGALLVRGAANPFTGTWVVRDGAQLRGYNGNSATGLELGTGEATVRIEPGGQLRFFNVTAGGRTFPQRLELASTGLAGGNPGGLNHDAATASTIRWSGEVAVAGTASVGVQNAARLVLDRVRPAAVAGDTELRLDAGGAGTAITIGDVADLGRLLKLGQGTATVTGSLAVPAGTLEVAEGRFALPADRQLVASLGGLAVGEGLLDLGMGRLEIAAGASAEDLRLDILAGRDGGSWRGSRGIASSAAAAVPGGVRTVGYRVGSDGAAVVAFAAPGDIDLNGKVDVFDIVAINAAGVYGSGGAATWVEGDMDYDGLANVFDLVAINAADVYNQAPYLPPAVAVATVPEPAGCGLMLVGVALGAGLIRRR